MVCADYHATANNVIELTKKAKPKGIPR